METYKVTVDNDKTIRWYNDKDQPHRLDGPAIEYANGSKAWYQESERHRLDGPAIEKADGSKEWFIDGKSLTEAEFLNKTSPLNEKTVEIDEKKYKLTLIS
jgi:hypothetical protein